MNRRIGWLTFGALVGWASACGIKEIDPLEGGATGSGGETSGSAGPGTGGNGISTGISTGNSNQTSAASAGTGLPAADGIACGSEVCAVPAEVCCVSDGGSSCQSAGAGCADLGAATVTKHCDDPSDCAAGQACCASDPTQASVSLECSTAPCAFVEVCVEGSTCSTGLACVDDAESPTGGLCPDPGVDCGDGTTCSGATPICCWDGQAGSCAAVGSNACIDAQLGCTSPSDCADGESCCGGNGGTSCKAACDPGETTFCQSDLDCGGASCTPAAGFPPGTSSCN